MTRPAPSSRSRASSRCRSAASIRRATRTGCWCASATCRSTWCRRWSPWRTAATSRTRASTCAAWRAPRAACSPTGCRAAARSRSSSSRTSSSPPSARCSARRTELVMAVLLELHYDKNEILETYLNEIYFGQDRDRAIHGVGLAAQFYFGKDVQYLGARRVGAAGRPDPRPGALRSLPPPAARARAAQPRAARDARPERDHAGAVRVGARQRAWASRKKTGTGTSPYPAFLQLVHRQLRRDYDENDLRTEGLRIFTTLDPRVQERGRDRARQAPRAVRQGQALRRAARPRRRGGGHRPAERRGAGDGRRTRPALSRLQPCARRRAPGRLAAQARHLPHGAERARASTPCSRRSTTGRSCGRAAARPTGSRRTTTRSSTAWCR